MTLIIVESPTKARTIKQFLGKDYEVVSSYGHIRDLPKSELGIDVENNFEPTYVIPPKSKKTLKELKAGAKKEKTIILATDEDREGESIAWHIAQVLAIPQTKLKRIAFHEITPHAIQYALDHPRAIDQGLVNAQKARRVLDRLVGYKLSPLLWKKILRGLSAGRVQSVALRLIVEREEERKKFIAQEYWTIEGHFDAKKSLLIALLDAVDGKKLNKFAIPKESEAKKIKEDLLKKTYGVEEIEKKESLKYPEPPFITSTLQQTAAQKFGWSASFTMSMAQKLYETGKITYMRTDSTNMAGEAITQAQKVIETTFGKNYARPSQWKTKVKLAQEAHEAIRPTSFAKSPESLDGDLGDRERKLYTLIWRRALASQMVPAVFMRTKITIHSNDKKYQLASNGLELTFDGFSRVYPLSTKDTILPHIEKGQIVTLKEVLPLQHFTQPPARFSEAMLIKALKEYGIGRPSTYAPTIEILKKRRYVEKDENKKFAPTLVGTKVNELLTEHFPDIVDIDFTARMEESLDEVASGEKDWLDIIRPFYAPFEKLITKKQKELTKRDFVQEPTDKICPQCNAPVVKKLGRFGEFYSCSRYPECKWAQQIIEKIGMKCPDCKDGDVIERHTKKGKLFYGCSRYPKCHFASWRKPKMASS